LLISGTTWADPAHSLSIDQPEHSAHDSRVGALADQPEHSAERSSGRLRLISGSQALASRLSEPALITE